MNLIEYHSIRKDLNKLRSEGITYFSFGFEQWDEVVKARKGYPIYLAGEPFSGKTEILLEILVNWITLYQWKVLVYLGETGHAHDIVAEIAHKLIGKPYFGDYQMNEKERLMAEYLIAEHIYIIPPDSRFTIDQFYANLAEIENDKNIKFDCAVIDPFNDVDELEYNPQYLNLALQSVNGQCYKSGRIDIILNHIGETQKIYDKTLNKRWKMPAHPDEWAGGKMWFRRAFTMLLAYRPPDFLVDETGAAIYAENQMQIVVQKAKPKGVGKLGVINLYWDWKKSRYYTKDNFLGEKYGAETKRDMDGYSQGESGNPF